MPFLAPALPFIVGGGVGAALTGLFGGGKNKNPAPDPYAALLGQLQPLIATQKEISNKAGEAGLANIGAARSDYDFVNNYLKNILTGSDDDLLKLLDVSSATRNIDENEQILSELGVRGGRRAAALGQTSFDRDAVISNVLKQLRFSAPTQIAQIGQAIGNLGLGELSASTGAGAQASNTLFGVEGLKQNDKDRRAALISSILTSVGGAAGAFLGSR